VSITTDEAAEFTRVHTKEIPESTMCRLSTEILGVIHVCFLPKDGALRRKAEMHIIGSREEQVCC
jgi:hypothetical protein